MTSAEDGTLLVSGLISDQIGQVASDNGITLFELAPQQASLEEAFMEMTGDAVEYRAHRPAEGSSMRSAPATLSTATAAGSPRYAVLNSEWIKLRTLRSTFWTLFAAIVATSASACCSAGASPAGSARATATASATPRPRGDRADRARTSSRSSPSASSACMVITGEYSTGMIRATLAAVPGRLPVLWAKAAVFGAVVLVLDGDRRRSLTFFGGAGDPVDAAHRTATLSSPQALRIVVGVGALPHGRRPPGHGARHASSAAPRARIAALFGILLVLPVLGEVLDLTSWGKHITPYLPSNAGGDLLTNAPTPARSARGPASGTSSLYAVVAMAVAAVPAQAPGRLSRVIGSCAR